MRASGYIHRKSHYFFGLFGFLLLRVRSTDSAPDGYTSGLSTVEMTTDGESKVKYKKKLIKGIKKS